MEGWVTERTEGRRGCSAAGLGHGFPGGADWPSAEPQNGQKRRPATHSFSTSTSTPSSRCVCVCFYQASLLLLSVRCSCFLPLLVYV